MAIKYLKSSNLKNKTVLVRGSVDVPVDEHGELSDDFRLRAFLPTLQFLRKHGNKVVICGKRGRPNGKVDPGLSLKPVAQRLAQLLNLKFLATDYEIPAFGIPHLVFYTGNICEEKHQEQLSLAPDKDVIVLENLEFHPEELDNNAKFAKAFASFADVYVDDDFTKCHHPVASNVAVTKYLPSYAGLLLEKEIQGLDGVLKHTQQPFVVMTGGVKLSEKVGALENLGKKADKILVGGGVGNLFFLSKGLEVGLSKVEEGKIKTAWQLEKNFKGKIMLPVDVVVANKNMDKNSIRVCSPYEVGKHEQILDAGPKTILEYSKEIKKAKTILWSGPLGMFEKKPFHHATMALARLIGGRGKGRAFVVVGGGDTLEAVAQAHQLPHIDHISTGGGAMLEYLAGKKLPAIEALKK